MNPLHAVRGLFACCIALFVSAVVGMRWGAQISYALLSPAQRVGADIDVLHGVWLTRSIFLFVLAAVCGLVGIYCSLQASEAHRP